MCIDRNANLDVTGLAKFYPGSNDVVCVVLFGAVQARMVAAKGIILK